MLQLTCDTGRLAHACRNTDATSCSDTAGSDSLIVDSRICSSELLWSYGCAHCRHACCCTGPQPCTSSLSIKVPNVTMSGDGRKQVHMGIQGIFHSYMGVNGPTGPASPSQHFQISQNGVRNAPQDLAQH